MDAERKIHFEGTAYCEPVGREIWDAERKIHFEGTQHCEPAGREIWMRNEKFHLRERSIASPQGEHPPSQRSMRNEKIKKSPEQIKPLPHVII
ncbi:MAG: hypothetical protein IIX29_00335 [Bacteroidales bacterium]|nr:hypothetical protein [Bacteroidales bacterium]